MGNKVVVNFEDFKANLRQVFTDHGVFTSQLIISSVPIVQPDSDSFKNKLLQNPTDIRVAIEPFVGVETALAVQNLFTEHLVLAATALEPVRNGDSVAIAAAVNNLLEQGDKVGAALGSVNPAKLSPQDAIDNMRTHNTFVAKLATLRQEGQYDEYVRVYTEYFNHLMGLSDAVAGAMPMC